MRLILRSIQIALLFSSLSLISCAVPVPPPTEIMTPLEQVLVSQAAEESAKQLYAHIPEGSRVAVESFGLTPRHPFLKGIVTGWLGRRGFSITERNQDADFLIRVMVQALGNDASERTFGTQGVESPIIPVGLPPITLFSRSANRGYARFYMDVYETGTGRLIHSTSPFVGSAYLNRYTFLFVITIRTTDLDNPP